MATKEEEQAVSIPAQGPVHQRLDTPGYHENLLKGLPIGLSCAPWHWSTNWSEDVLRRSGTNACVAPDLETGLSKQNS